jgi:hypothetical protein
MVYDFQVFNLLGELVYQLKDLEFKGTYMRDIDISHLPSGSYNIVLRSREKILHKLIIIHK